LRGSSKRKTKTRRLLRQACSLAFAAAVACAACAGPERPLLEQFFAASRLRDRTALQKISTTIFEPRARGIVRQFEIVKVVPRADGSRRDVTIVAPVATPDGRTVQETLDVSLERDAGGRWIVTAVNESGSRP
jgi:hypothetical protein